MYCSSVPVAGAGLAARQALALRAPVVAVVAVVASGSLCSRALKCWPHTLLASCLSALVLVVQQERA